MKSINFKFCLIVLFLFFALGCRSVQENSIKSPNFHDGKFRNYVPRENQKNLYKLVKFLFFEERGSWPKWVENKTKPSFSKAKNETVITFLNHATYLAEVEGKRLLFDPIFSDNAGPNSYFGVKRIRPPALPMAELPTIDYIFISHNHYDHLDLPSLKFISNRDKPLIFVPLGDKEWLEDEGISNIIELDWWQKYKINKCFTVNFVPAQHSSSRTPFDLDISLWGGYVVEGPSTTLFHAGDTGYAGHFKEIGNKFDIDIAMLPIGDYQPKWFLEYVHMDPKQALMAHIDLNSKQSFAMHSETFPLSTLGYNEAEKEFNEAYEAQKFSYPFEILEVGESVSYQVTSSCE